MATLINRSRDSPLSPATTPSSTPASSLTTRRRSRVAYLKSLRADGFPRARISQGDDHWYVRIRQRGYKTLNFDAGS